MIRTVNKCIICGRRIKKSESFCDTCWNGGLVMKCAGCGDVYPADELTEAHGIDANYKVTDNTYLVCPWCVSGGEYTTFYWKDEADYL